MISTIERKSIRLRSHMLILTTCSFLSSCFIPFQFAQAETVAAQTTERSEETNENSSQEDETNSSNSSTETSSDNNADASQASDGAPNSTYLEVVVSATGFEQNVKDAPASISVIPGKEIEKGAFHDLTDALRNVQGVAVTGSAGEQDVFIRGLPGQYTLILIDGKRMNTRESRVNGSSGFEQSFIPQGSAIERIEVIRGPMSSLYGSDAMGGVINIITKKVPEKWTASFTTDYTANEKSQYGNSYLGSFYTAGPIQPGVVGAQLWGRAFNRQEDELINGTPRKKERDIHGRITITPNEDHDIMIDGGTTSLKRYTSIDSKSYNFNDRDFFSASHTGRWGWTTSDFSVQQEITKRRTWEWNEDYSSFEKSTRSPKIRNTTYDGKFTTPFELWGNHTLVTGGQYIQSKLTDQNPGKRVAQDYRYSIDQWALFLEDEWWLTHNFSLTGGLRVDKHDLYKEHWSPRLYAVWHATDNLTVKGGVSSGFRAPDMRSIIPGYAYTSGGRGCYYGNQAKRPSSKTPCAVIIGGDNLQAEKSTSYEFALLYDTLGGLQLGATYFYTDFKDKITNERAYDANGDYIWWSEDPNYSVIYNLNIDKATLQGVELTAAWEMNEQLHFRANYTYTDSEQKTGDYKGLPLARTPEHMANLRVDWNTALEGLSFWGSGNYHGKEKNAGLRIGTNGKAIYKDGKIIAREYDDYFTADIGGAYKFNDKITLNAAVYNLFNKEVTTDEFNNVLEGRRYWISLNSTF